MAEDIVSSKQETPKKEPEKTSIVAPEKPISPPAPPPEEVLTPAPAAAKPANQTFQEMKIAWDKIKNVLGSLAAAYEVISSFYDDWKNAPPPVGTASQSKYTLEFIISQILASRSISGSIATAKLITDKQIDHDPHMIVMLGYLVNGFHSMNAAIQLALNAPASSDLFETVLGGSIISEYLSQIDEIRLNNVVALLHKYDGMASIKTTIYDNIANAYCNSSSDSWNNLLANSNLDLSQLNTRIWRLFIDNKIRGRAVSFLHTFIDRISSNSLKQIFYAKIDSDSEIGQLIFKEFLPKKPDIDRAAIIIDAETNDDENEGTNTHVLGTLVGFLDAHEMKRFETEYLKIAHSTGAVFNAMIKSPHSDKAALYGFIAKHGPRAARSVLTSFLNSDDESDNDEDKKRINIPVLQKIIEKSQDRDDILLLIRCTEEFKNINFPSAKKRFNDLTTKENAEKPQTLETAKSRILEYFEHKSRFEHDEVFDRFLNAWVDLCFEKKDWFYLDNDFLFGFIYNAPMKAYIKHKPNPASSIYHDIKNNYDNVNSMRRIVYKVKSFSSEFRRLDSGGVFLETIVNKSQNFSQYVKYMERLASVLPMMHNTDISDDIARKIILNPAMNLEDKTIEEFIEIMGEVNKTRGTSQQLRDSNISQSVYHIHIENIKKVNPKLIDEKAFFHNMNVFETLNERFNQGEPIKFSHGTPEYNAVKQLHTQLKLITQFETIKEHIAEAKPKDKRMFELNWVHPSGLKFEVMGYLDPAAFSIGAETNCCQRIGGVGEDAAIDSFINPTASVLTVSYDGRLISQSYFHIVSVPPDGMGVILDNIEHNETNEKSVGLTTNSLTKAYADWAQAMREKNKGIRYILCGKDYSKINNSMFSNGAKMAEDPREFSVDDPYTDFDEDDHLDLLKPAKQLEGITVSPHSPKRAFVEPHQTQIIITRAMVRRMVMIKSADVLDLFASLSG